MSTRYLLLALAVGCVTSDPAATGQASDEVTATAPVCQDTLLGRWCTESLPEGVGTPLLHSVFAISVGNVFAVGENGTILQRINNAWTATPSGTSQNLLGVWAASASDVWAVGAGGAILRYNGTTWSIVINGDGKAALDAVWGSSSTDVWFVGAGQLKHWNGVALSDIPSSGHLLSVSGSGPHDMWTTGDSTSVRRFDGTSGKTCDHKLGLQTFSAVLVLSPTDVWVANTQVSGAEIAHMTSCTSRGVPQSTSGGFFNGLSAISASDIWGAGASRVGQYDGSKWTTVTLFQGLRSITTAGVAGAPDNVWVVGDTGLIAHRPG